LQRIKELTLKLKTPSGLNELENEPAYKRRSLNIEDAPHSSESNVSRFTINEETDQDSGEKKWNLRDSNSFLHDQVD
jgi:cell division protein FtsZ